MIKNKKTLGQVWTPDFIVSDMLSLIKNEGTILEPSVGEGAFYKNLPKKTIGIEIDKELVFGDVINIDFFDFPVENKFDTIIGNPPYVSFDKIPLSTLKIIENTSFFDKLDKRTNLYIFFIWKAIKHLNENGELIFITPRDFLNNTSGRILNKFIYENGTITDFIDLSDRKIFFNADVDTIIWRFEKGNFSRKTNYIHNFILTSSNQILLTKNKPFSYLNEFLKVKVGAASGMNSVFKNDEFGIPFVTSSTIKTGKYEYFIYNKKHNSIEKYKELLMTRKIGKFSKENWFKWGRKFYTSKSERIYVNSKTRNNKPFFYSPIKNYDGSVLAIFDKDEKITIKQCNDLVNFLNSLNWKEKGFVAGERYIFSQKSLENAFLTKKEHMKLKNILLKN